MGIQTLAALALRGADGGFSMDQTWATLGLGGVLGRLIGPGPEGERLGLDVVPGRVMGTGPKSELRRELVVTAGAETVDS